MGKHSFFSIAVFFVLFLLMSVVSNAQCTMLSFNQYKEIWNAKSKDDKLTEMGFSKRSGYYGRCKIEMCSTPDSVSRNWNEFLFVYDDEINYSFVDKAAFENYSAFIKTKAKYVGHAMFDEQRREYYFDGKTCYALYVGERSCLNSQITDYNFSFLIKVPAYVEKD